ncbi:MAG: FkbM family methyltransferase [Planctomycetota bacterium]|nr:FkbM family methyltransferase [Planctomycetota bacterium]
MINFFKKILEKRKVKRTFKEYGYKVRSFSLREEGEVKFAQWLNPAEQPKEMSQSKVDFFKKFIKKESFAIDIGAHIGDTTIPMAIAAGKEGLVLALDPNPYVFKILEVNSSLNKDKARIIPLCFAATDADGEFYYNSSEATFNNGGISEIKSKKHGRYSLNQKIKGINLENYLRKNYRDLLPNLSLIKIDAEGYDKEVLKSISKLIEEFKPSIIVECFSKLTKQERYELFDIIENKGYILFYFQDFEVNTDIKQIAKNDMTNWEHFDIYAIPQEKYCPVRTTG